VAFSPYTGLTVKKRMALSKKIKNIVGPRIFLPGTDRIDTYSPSLISCLYAPQRPP
jgi:hypothetical protein